MATSATNIWAKNPQGDEKVGNRLIMTLNETGADHWTGSAFDPQRDQTYTMSIRVADKMTTDGCVMGGLTCESMNWTRLNRSM